MVINLRQLYEIPGERLEFTDTVSSDRLNIIHGFSFLDPVALEGEISNRAGVVNLKLTVRLAVAAECDRCLGSFTRSFTFENEHILVRTLNSADNDEYVVTEGDELDLTELAVADMLLQMPTKLLCREDCRGLCPVCGADLNVSDCGCNSGS